MSVRIGTVFLAFASGVAFAFDPLAIEWRNPPTNDDEMIAYTLLYEGHRWEDNLDALAKNLGNERVGKRIVEFMEPVFDIACASTCNDKEYRLCQSGVSALGYIQATNSLPFLERAVLHGSEDLCHTALYAYRQIMGYGDSYIDLLDRALREGVITRYDHAAMVGGAYMTLNEEGAKNTPGTKLKIVIRLINNPTRVFLLGSRIDDKLLAGFPSYTNSVERLTALATILEEPLTPPEGHTKYDSELARLRALPPESLVRVTDELEAQLDALLKAAERKRKIEQVKKYAVPAGIAVLALAALVVIIRKRFR